MAKLKVRNDSGATIYLEDFGHQELLDGETIKLKADRNIFIESTQLQTEINAGNIVVIDDRGDVLPATQAQNLREGTSDDELQERASFRIVIYGKAAAGSPALSLVKGDPVHISSYDSVNDEYEFVKADADAASFPASGVVNGDTITSAQGGHVVVVGRVTDLNTAAWSAGDLLYLSATGTLTNVRPTTAANQVQCVAQVAHSHATEGVIMVGGPLLGTHSLPNLTQTKFWLGDGTDVPQETTINDLTADASPNGAADYVMSWDADAGSHKKVLMNNLPGGGGGGMVTGISKNSGATINAANRSVLNFIEGSGVTLTITDDAGGDEVDITIAASGGGGSGKIVQVVHGTVGVAEGTSTIPDDNTEPTSTEGTQVATLAITPSSASNKVWVQITLQMASSGEGGQYVTVFRGSTLVAMAGNEAAKKKALSSVQISVIDSPGTASQVTYSVRVGGNPLAANTWYVNKNGNNATFGGAPNKQSFILSEISV